ncbi:hypothetical protein rosag_46020 [Roseisolibacter agri]|uniref:Uncharacterized protein n=1 Tax=Roseisolibacter agri TaxID=2014610 RepID=A0AA37Q891_9BACT|nr:hypothetical protein rosag_46020 [Roseisolibacter agri]
MVDEERDVSGRRCGGLLERALAHQDDRREGGAGQEHAVATACTTTGYVAAVRVRLARGGVTHGWWDEGTAPAVRDRTTG